MNNTSKKTSEPPLPPGHDERAKEMAKRFADIKPMVKSETSYGRGSTGVLMNQNEVLVGLSRLLANENLIFDFDPKAPTASFDVVSRTLTLPTWNVHFFIMEMLVGHEVGHALYTPVDEFMQVRENKGKEYQVAWQMYLNIVEDDRIERMIQNRFPGYRPIFFKAYKTLHNTGIFGLMDSDFDVANLSKMRLIDRVNLESKIGTFVRVPFVNDTEKKILANFKSSKTFADVIAVAEEIWQYDSENHEPQPQDNNSQSDSGNSDTGNNGINLPGKKNKPKEKAKSKKSDNALPDKDDNAKGEKNSDKESPNGNSGGDDSEDSEDGSGSGDEPSDKTENSDSEGDSDGESGDGESGDSDGDAESETSAGEGESDSDSDNSESADGPPKNGKATPSNNPDSNQMTDEEVESPTETTTQNYGNNGTVSPNSKPKKEMEIPTTAAEFAKNLESLSGIQSFFNLSLPTVNVNDWILRPKFDKLKQTTEFRELTQAFMAEKTPIISGMIRLFNEKKTASESARVQISKSGLIDPLRLSRYMFEDDIFARNMTIQAGKNHGMVMLLDWSGSIEPVVAPMIEQVALFAIFCRKLKLPCTLFSFMSWTSGHYYGHPNEMVSHEDLPGDIPGSKRGLFLNPKQFESMETLDRKAPDRDMIRRQSKFGPESGKKTVAINEHLNYQWFDTASMTDSEFMVALGQLLYAGMLLSGRQYHITEPFNYGSTKTVDIYKRIMADSLHPLLLSLGGTPLNESLLVMRSFMEKYQKDNKYEISNLMVVTDGQSNSDFPGGTRYVSSMGIIKDQKSGRLFTIDIRRENTVGQEIHYPHALPGTLRLLKLLRSVLDCNTNLVFIGSEQVIRIMSKTLDGQVGVVKNPKNPKRSLMDQFELNNKESVSFDDGYTNATHLMVDPTNTYITLTQKLNEYNGASVGSMSATKIKKTFAALSGASKTRGTFFIQAIIPIIAQSPLKNDPKAQYTKTI